MRSFIPLPSRTASMGLVLLKHLAIEEQESAKGLVLRRGGNVLTGSRMDEKGLDFGLAHIAGMLLVVEKDIPFDPGEIALFSPERIVFQPKSVSNLIQ
ncbi:MAG: hypothetical protein DDT28_01144 [Dehalococcoidia bacterium]|nr:hypothetical protein [Chloroflexota bacterium]